MDKDIVPDLLEKIESEFNRLYDDNPVIKSALSSLAERKATYVTANDFAIEVGEVLSKALSSHITSDNLPDGKMYYNIANRILETTLSRNHELIAGYAEYVQDLLNSEAGIGLKVQKPDFNKNRLDGLVNRLSSEQVFDDVKWLIEEPVVNFSQSIVDDTIRKNAEFHYDAGLRPRIVRKEAGKCCDWCREVVGVFYYPKVPQDVYRRHNRCRCVVDYHPGNGKKQNVHSKRWSDPQKNAKIEARKKIGLPIQSGAKNYFRDESNDDVLPKDFIKAEKHAYLTYDRIKNSNQALEKRKIYSNIGKFKEMKDFTKEDVDIAFNHVFNDVHNLNFGKGNFPPDIDMAASWERLISGKGIQPHDLILLRHERLEHDYMYVTGKMDYDTAHSKVDERYNYSVAADKYKKKG